MNIMDESFLSQLSWDDNNQSANPRGELRSSEVTSTEEMVTTTTKAHPIQPKDTIISQLQQQPIKMQTAKVSQYQPIKPATAQQSHKQQKIQPQPTTVPSTIILTQNRQNMTTSSPTTQILVQQNPTTTSYYNLKTIAPSNQKTKHPKSIQPAPATLPVMQLIQTSGDKQQMLLQTNPTVMYTTGNDGQNIQLVNAPILTTVPLVINSDGESHFTIGSKSLTSSFFFLI